MNNSPSPVVLLTHFQTGGTPLFQLFDDIGTAMKKAKKLATQYPGAVTAVYRMHAHCKTETTVKTTEVKCYE